MSEKVSCFVAYPSKPPALAETIVDAITKIKDSEVVSIDSWKSTSVIGKFVIVEICRAIEERDIFVCDLTSLNHNVLFELGFAIAKRKKIWILLDESIEPTKTEYKKFNILVPIGYCPYNNSNDIVKAFYREEPYSDLSNTIYKHAIESVISQAKMDKLFYLKSRIETDASIKLSRIINKTRLKQIVDDPVEIGTETLQWYAQKVCDSYAVVAHLLGTDRTGYHLHNAKNSLICGLSYGFGKHILMLAHEPYDTPIDYHELLKIHKTADECERFATQWLEDVEKDYAQRGTAARKYQQDRKVVSELQDIVIGDAIAELESEDLHGYFVRTASYLEALKSKHSIFVGRKGTGKTAILFELAKEIGADSRNHICIIKPVAYELEGILRMLKQTLPKSEKGYLVESFWKFLIYTELAKSVYEKLQSRPSYHPIDDIEDEFLKFVEQNFTLITPDFSIRLELVVSRLGTINEVPTAQQQRLKISELLHDNMIAKLRSILGKVLEKKNRVVILIDNLDKAWNPRGDLLPLSDLLLGFLTVSQTIAKDFEKTDRWRKPVKLSVILFLRSDIYSQIVKFALEKDKILPSRITWDDPHMLLSVVEERFLASSEDISYPEQVWARYFCSTVNDEPTREFIASSILPRPRDLIYLCKTAIAEAINRRHIKVEEDDIKASYKKYSQYALDSLISENSIPPETLEALLYEFVDSEAIVTEFDIQTAMEKCGLSKGRFEEVIELLCALTFLGREVEDDRFEFQYSEDHTIKLQVMARKTAEKRADKTQRFLINRAFHPYLEIKPLSATRKKANY